MGKLEQIKAQEKLRQAEAAKIAALIAAAKAAEATEQKLAGALKNAQGTLKDVAD